MPCSPCYSLFLSQFPDVQASVHESLDKMLALPLAALQAELEDQMGALDQIALAVDGYNADFLGAEELYSDILGAMDLEGILPGECPQLDNAISNIQSFGIMSRDFSNPLAKQVNTLSSRIGQIAGMAATANLLIAQAEGLRC